MMAVAEGSIALLNPQVPGHGGIPRTDWGEKAFVRSGRPVRSVRQDRPVRSFARGGAGGSWARGWLSVSDH